MASTITRSYFTLLFLAFTSFSFGQKFGFQQVLKDAPDEITVFCVPNTNQNKSLLNGEGIRVKYSSSAWLFISATPRWINDHKIDGSLSDFYFEYAPPSVLADTSRATHYVDQVHAGQAPLESSYTGAGVIVGVIDQGLDWQHPDFIDANGDTRVLRYWDHSYNGPNPAPGYGYGQLWDSTDINNGSCTSLEESSAHGTSVTGLATGDGSANGTNMGMAPDANIVFVETNFNLPNWTLTIADGIDYIFSVADQYGMPAVVNLSLGSYFGSHDGNDPAAEAIETLLDAQPGRIVVSAAGNSGNQGTYHQQGNPTADTSFVWFLNNPSAVLGANTIFFDLWSDNADTGWNFALAADSPGPAYDFRGRTNFHGATSSIGTTIYDTIWNGSNRIATIEVFTEMVNNNYHMQMFVSNVDSTSYLYRFETTGSGKYDLWSGQWLGYNDMVTSLPTVGQMPAIVDYVLPDTNQTIVSSWNCSEKVVSVGNVKNRKTFTDMNLTTTVAPYSPGILSENSSKGPNRHNVIKPDVTATGDGSLSSGPLWLLQNPAYNTVIDSGGWHVLNGGTSMASPVVAGIAALYLERCNFSTYDQFLTDLKATAFTDQFTGAVPNNAFGYGKPNAYLLLQEQTLPAQPVISWSGGTTITSTPSTGYQWYLDGQEINGETNQSHTGVPPLGTYQVMIINDDGCSALSDPYVASVGIDEVGIKSLNVYPNPSSSTIQIDTEEKLLNVEFVDMNGKTFTIDSIGENTYNLETLPSGTYNVIITTEKGTAQSKVIRL